MLQGLSCKGFRSTVASVFVENVELESRTKSKCWRFDQICSLRRPQLLQINELRRTRMELNVARWTKIKSRHDDNDARGLPESHCLRARFASMAGGRWCTLYTCELFLRPFSEKVDIDLRYVNFFGKRSHISRIWYHDTYVNFGIVRFYANFYVNFLLYISGVKI